MGFGSRILFWFKKHWAILSLLGMTVLYLAVLELRFPLFFLQDDAYAGWLPNVVQNWNSLFSGGQFSFYDFHRLLGIPTLAMGQSAVFYPPAYLSMALSLLFVGDFYITVEIMAFMHILLGIISMFYLVKKLSGGNDLISILSAVIFMFSAYVLFVGAAWLIVTVVAGYLPLLLLLSIKMHENNQKRWYIFYGIAIFLFFCFGHFEYFLKTCVAVFLAVLCLFIIDCKNKKPIKSFVIRYVITHVIILLLILPQVLSMFFQTQIAGGRTEKFSFKDYLYGNMWSEKFSYFLGLFFVVHGDETPNFRNMSYIGIIPIVLLIIFIVLSIINLIKRKKNQADKWTYISFGMFIFFALWFATPIAALLYYVPIFNQFRYLHKMILYMNFFIALFAGLYLLKFNLKKWMLWLAIVIQFVGGFLPALLLDRGYVWLTKSTDEEFSRDLIDHITDDGKVISLVYRSYNQADEEIPTAQTLFCNYATYYQKYTFNGYEHLISIEHREVVKNFNEWTVTWDILNKFNFCSQSEDLKIILTELEEWGVKWFIADKVSFFDSIPKTLAEHYEYVYENDKAVLYKNNKVKDVFYFAGSNNVVTNYKINYNDMYVKTHNETEDVLIVNFYNNPQLEVYIDGQKAQKTGTDRGQIAINLPAGEHNIKIAYRDKYFEIGCVISASVLCLIAGAYIILCYINKRKK
jgi:uncharacterized membrane protein YfhO